MQVSSAFAVSQSLSAAAGSTGEYMAYLSEGKDPLTASAMKDIVMGGASAWKQLAGWVNEAREHLGETGKDL